MFDRQERGIVFLHASVTPAKNEPWEQVATLLLNPCDGFHLVYAKFDGDGEFDGFYDFAGTEPYGADFFVAYALLPDELPLIEHFDPKRKLGHRDARHAAAELVCAAGSAPEPAWWAGALNRRATVEQWMFDAARGKRPMPSADELRAWAIKLGTPEPGEPAGSPQGKISDERDPGLAAAWKTLHDDAIPASNRYVRAIKAHREASGSSLLEAKDAVDGLKSGHLRPPAVLCAAGVPADPQASEGGKR